MARRVLHRCGLHYSALGLLALSAAACQPDHCDQLCTRTAAELANCLDEWSAEWTDLDTRNRASFRASCRTRWSEERADLEARELEDALEQCDAVLGDLQEMENAGTTCDQLRAIYLE